MSQPNKIRISIDSIGYVAISGLSREDFDRLGGDLQETHYPPEGAQVESWHKKFVVCDGKGAYLDLDFRTEEPPATSEPLSTDNPEIDS